MKALLYLVLALLGVTSLRAGDSPGSERLLGTWKSNRDLTVEAIKPHLKLPPDQQEQIFGVFGHLQMTYAKDRLEGEMRLPDKEPWKFTASYQVVARTMDTLTVRETRMEEGQEITTQVLIHFVTPDRYWVQIPQSDALKEVDMSEWKEFFDRVKP